MLMNMSYNNINIAASPIIFIPAHPLNKCSGVKDISCQNKMGGKRLKNAGTVSGSTTKLYVMNVDVLFCAISDLISKNLLSFRAGSSTGGSSLTLQLQGLDPEPSEFCFISVCCDFRLTCETPGASCTAVATR